MSILNQVAGRASTLAEVFSFLRERKLWWMMPLFILLLLLGLIIVLVQSSAVAPWLYPL
ncbi:MAG: DUF5989 family protein [Acidobacteriia bacterium]|nr:DUF5989 family protein [Terriglobia bacterium]